MVRRYQSIGEFTWSLVMGGKSAVGGDQHHPVREKTNSYRRLALGAGASNGIAVCASRAEDGDVPLHRADFAAEIPILVRRGKACGKRIETPLLNPNSKHTTVKGIHMIMTAQSSHAHVDSGLYEMEALFYTERLAIHARMISPERRLSDHLNSSVRTVEVKPMTVERGAASGAVDLGGMSGPLTKSRILFVVPISEPSRGEATTNYAWKQMIRRECWIGLGSYSLRGTIHTDAHIDPGMALRLIDKQFIAVTDVTTTTSRGDQLHFPVVIVNRDLVDLLAIPGGFQGLRGRRT